MLFTHATADYIEKTTQKYEKCKHELCHYIIFTALI